MSTENLTTPGALPSDGDLIKITHENGATEIKHFWESPEAETTPETPKANLSKLEFINRFTDQELVGIYQAAAVSIPVQIWLDKFKLAEFINTSDPQTISGVNNLELAGMIVAGRANEILNS